MVTLHAVRLDRRGGPGKLTSDRFDLAWPPGLVEERGLGVVEPQDREEPLVWNCLEPVVLLPVGGCRPEVDVGRAVRVGLDGARLAPEVRLRLVGLEHGAGLAVIEYHRPESALVEGGWERQPVVAGPVEVLPIAAARRTEVLRADTGEVHAHGGGDAGRDVEEPRARVELAGAIARAGDDALGGHLRGWVQELVAPGEEPVEPLRAGVVGDVLLGPGRERDGAGGRLADDDGVFEDLAHPSVGLERLALDDPDGGE